MVQSFQGRQVDGVIVSSSRVGKRYAHLLQDSGIPLVLINTHVDHDHMHAVYHDDYRGGRRLMEHLLSRGYRRIAYLGDARGGRITLERRRAWHDVLTEAGLAATVTMDGPTGRIEGGVTAGEHLLAVAHAHWGKPPEAICCYNDLMAIGVLSVLARHGLKIPDDVAVTGFDDLDVAAFTAPPLTTLHQPRREMGAQAMRVLLHLINNQQEQQPRETVMLGDLIIRGST